MAYEQFSRLYDDLMEDAPYDQWVTFVKRASKFADRPIHHILDIGCGTGEISLRLAQLGYALTGVDISDDMLAIAQEKALEDNRLFPLFQQDMRELSLSDTFDMAIIFCDSLNYLESLNDVKETFIKVYEHLNGGGLLLFDVHSLHKINELFVNRQFCLNEDKVAYIWESFPGPEPNSVYHDLTFFSELPSGLYQRFDETHFQKTYSVKEYLNALQEAGLCCLNLSADFTSLAPNEESERVFFIAKKDLGS
ncbi:methyltransferase family protein [Scopulibacillus darangshiensis]|uniref:Methyltransferase family protein n=1 Tax=Scopulibacillus darangshiensis TaxID=442528 RepID=A0A4R2PB47_9BACL|nr:class I SAM-dependent methyltransferase [Scopulibacillus darangshiensis]TCP32320.1 methyltransferase family protein [Scopulibacillus darangshiensis]